MNPMHNHHRIINSNIDSYNNWKGEQMRLNLEIIAFIHKITQSLAFIIESTTLEYCNIVIILKNRSFLWFSKKKLDGKNSKKQNAKKCKIKIKKFNKNAKKNAKFLNQKRLKL